MTVAFLNGWGIGSEEIFQDWGNRYPDTPISIVQPTPRWQSELNACDSDMLVGYSTGAFLALRSTEWVGKRFSRVSLLAPFVDFRAEAQRGGRVTVTQLKYLLRWLGRDPLAAVNDFRKRAEVGEPLDVLPVAVDDLAWGIELLLEGEREDKSSSQFESYLGSEDKLLDAAVLKRELDGLRVVEGAGHGLSGLLQKTELGL